MNNQLCPKCATVAAIIKPVDKVWHCYSCGTEWPARAEDVAKVSAFNQAMRETYRNDVQYICTVRPGVVVTGQTKMECARNAVVERLGLPWHEETA